MAEVLLMPKNITPAQLKDFLTLAKIPAVYEKGWDTPGIDPYRSSFRPVGVVLHHTANGGAKGNTPSLDFCVRGTYPPVRNCQFLIGRDGAVHVVAGAGCYHAGAGGPLTVNGYTIQKDQGNRYLYGIEIESKGTAAHVTAGPNDANGFTPAQILSASRLTAALCRLLGTDDRAVIRHRDWAPGRKSDVLQPLSWWKEQIESQFPDIDDALYPKPTGLWDGIVPSLPILTAVQKNGTANRATYRLACRLADLGFFTGTIKAEGVQAYPRVAVRAFKRAKFIGVTGRYGKKVHAALFEGQV